MSSQPHRLRGLPLAKGMPAFVPALWLIPLVARRGWARLGGAGVAAVATWFFRDPERTATGPGIVAAADGVVRAVTREQSGATTISTYLNLLDVHVTRAPMDATVLDRNHRPGDHRRASSGAADANERLRWTLDTEYGVVVLTQYAGLVARRIVAYREPGAVLRRGDRIGLIRFGSRVDVTLPHGVSALVQPGQRLRAGASVIAEPEAT